VSGLQVPMPGGGFSVSQIGLGQHLGQVPAHADLLTVRRQPGNGRAILEQDKGDVLIMGAVDAIGKIYGEKRRSISTL